MERGVKGSHGTCIAYEPARRLWLIRVLGCGDDLVPMIAWLRSNVTWRRTTFSFKWLRSVAGHEVNQHAC